MTQKVVVLLKAGPRRPSSPRLGGLVAHSWFSTAFFVQREMHVHAQICIGFGRAKWMTVSLNSFTILIIISILFDPFFPCMLLSEKRCHALFILCLFVCLLVHFACPNLMQICACAWIYRWTKKLWKIRTGPPGLWAAGLLGLQATGRSGHQAAGSSRAVGLLLAKPKK